MHQKRENTGSMVLIIEMNIIIIIIIIIIIWGGLITESFNGGGTGITVDDN